MCDIGPVQADLAQHEGHVLERLFDLVFNRDRVAGEFQSMRVQPPCPDSSTLPSISSTIA